LTIARVRATRALAFGTVLGTDEKDIIYKSGARRVVVLQEFPWHCGCVVFQLEFGITGMVFFAPGTAEKPGATPWWGEPVFCFTGRKGKKEKERKAKKGRKKKEPGKLQKQGGDLAVLGSG